MAKIDTSKIEGYEQMSAEDKLKALEAFEYDDGASEIERYKNAVSKANSEAADWKKKHNALLSDEDKKQQEEAEKIRAMQIELDGLRRDKTISEHKAQFIGLGYDEILASETAAAMADGDIAKVFANQKKFLEEHDKTLKADAMKNTPTPPAGSGTNGIDYDKAIAEANARGDMATVAALIREQQELINKK